MKLNGYRPTHRNKWLFLKHEILNVQELAFLEFCADFVDFDKNHEDYGLFEIDFVDVSKIFCCSKNTVRNWLKKLLDIGFIKKSEKRSHFRMSCHERYINPGHWGGRASEYAKKEKDQPVGIILQNFDIDSQTIEQKTQSVEENPVKSASEQEARTLNSSKDDSMVNQRKIVVIKQPPRTDDEYERIHAKKNFRDFPIKDMRWIDENVTEEIDVTNPDIEKDCIEVFFNGNWDEYRRYLITK